MRVLYPNAIIADSGEKRGDFEEVREDVVKRVIKEKAKPTSTVLMELKDAAQIKINDSELEDAIYNIAY